MFVLLLKPLLPGQAVQHWLPWHCVAVRPLVVLLDGCVRGLGKPWSDDELQISACVAAELELWVGRVTAD